jgi:transposase-like protein
MTKPLFPTPDDLSLPEIMARFPDEESAICYFEGIRWPNGIACPHCGNEAQDKFWKITANGKKVRVGLRQCAVCLKQFRVTVGTIFEDSHIPLNKWIIAWYLLSGAKKGMSALQLQRHLGIGSYRTAWFMAHRIRHAMKDPVFEGKLSGTVEVDECYVGPISTSDKPRDKSAVVALVERESGKRRSVVFEAITAERLHQAIRTHVEEGSSVHTDESTLYKKLPKEFKHRSVLHAKVKGKPRYHYRDKTTGEIVTTNFAESSFSLLRRGIAGSFHHISRKHLAKYVAEFDFRWNHRKTSDGARCVEGLKKCEGKRLTYKPLMRTHKPEASTSSPRKRYRQRSEAE